VVSGFERSVRIPSDNDTTALLVAAMQTDASINPGNGGGMLADCAGDLVGVPTAGATASDSLTTRWRSAARARDHAARCS
jgi:putative serine protease PepD